VDRIDVGDRPPNLDTHAFSKNHRIHRLGGGDQHG